MRLEFHISYCHDCPGRSVARGLRCAWGRCCWKNPKQRGTASPLPRQWCWRWPGPAPQTPWSRPWPTSTSTKPYHTPKPNPPWPRSRSKPATTPIRSEVQLKIKLNWLLIHVQTPIKALAWKKVVSIIFWWCCSFIHMWN